MTQQQVRNINVAEGAKRLSDAIKSFRDKPPRNLENLIAKYFKKIHVQPEVAILKLNGEIDFY